MALHSIIFEEYTRRDTLLPLINSDSPVRVTCIYYMPEL